MAEVRTNLGQGVLAVNYAGGLGAVTVTPATDPRGPFPSSGVFSVEAIPDGATAGAIYTVSTVTPSGGNQVLTLIALEFGTDVALTGGATFVEVESVRSLQALIDQSISTGGGGIGFNPTTQTDVTGSRSLGTVFHNTTGAPIWVNVVAGGVTGHNFQAFSDAANPPTTLVASEFVSNGFGVQGLTFIVLPGNFYSVAYDVGGGSLGLWIEWTGAQSNGLVPQTGKVVGLVGSQTWGPIYEFTPPVAADFAGLNFAGCTVDASRGSLVMVIPNSGSDVWVGQEQALASPQNYDVVVALASFTQSTQGVYIRNSVSGNGVVLRLSSGGNSIIVDAWNMNTFTFLGSIASGGGPSPMSSPFWMRITDDGSRVLYRVSVDGFHWMTVGNRPSLVDLAPDRVGFVVDSSSTNYGSAGTYNLFGIMYSWAKS